MAVEKRQRDRRYEDYMTNRILAIFTYAFLLILGLMFAYRMYSSIDTMFAIQKVLYVVAAIAAAGLVASIIWELVGAKRELKVICGRNLAVACAILAVCAFCGAYFTSNGIRMMYVFVPITCALVLVYLLYPRDFFFTALVMACAAVLLWYMSRATGAGFIWTRGIKAGKALYGTIAAIVLLAAYIVALLKLKKSNGMLKIKGAEREIFPKGAHYLLSLITAGVTALMVLAGYICGGTAAYYLVFATVAYLFVLAVYYTVKMM